MVKRCRMELHKLDIGYRSTSAQRHSDAVTRRLKWIRRHRKDLPGSA